jgi:hypothetical protein
VPVTPRGLRAADLAGLVLAENGQHGRHEICECVLGARAHVGGLASPLSFWQVPGVGVRVVYAPGHRMAVEPSS